MSEVLREVLPLALAIAASPFTIIPAILLLFTPRAAAAGSAFLGGWLVSIAASVTVFVLLASVIEAFEETPTWAAWLKLILGAVLVVLAVRQWLGRRTPKPAPAWMRSIESATPGKAVGLAFLLSLANPKILLLSAAAGLGIGAAELGTGQAAVVVVGFTVVAALSVAVPVVLYLVLGKRMLGPLGRARDWLVANNAAVMAVVFLVIGVMLVVEGVGVLRS
jgi:threonine/homoserine/homoserine lactone efflux protein